ncbi:MAG: sugar phosphate isomerase/epimerase family protein, partial [Bryobacteraceae bacterium]
QYGLEWIELRGVPGPKKEYARLPETDVRAAAAELAASGLKVSFLNTSLLKFAWPGTEPIRRPPGPAEQTRFDRRLDDLGQAIRAAHLFGVDKIRVFTGTRVAQPHALFPRIAEVLGEMARIAEKEKVKLLIENEGSCNVATGSETAALLELLPSKAIGINWDPLNEASQKEKPFPEGYSLLPKKRIGNVQIKGKSLLEDARRLDWKAIFAALERDGYTGQVGLETHYFDGTLIEKSHASIREILRIVS